MTTPFKDRNKSSLKKASLLNKNVASINKKTKNDRASAKNWDKNGTKKQLIKINAAMRTKVNSGIRIRLLMKLRKYIRPK